MGLFDILEAVVGTVYRGAERTMERQRGEMNRQIRQYEKKVDAYEQNHPNSAKVAEARERLEAAKARVNGSPSHARRTDREIENDPTGTDQAPTDFEIREHIALRDAKNSASGSPGVYILYLDGSIMKCGRAAFAPGIRWRFQQYYNLKYDKRAQHGDHWAINEENRDRVIVSWQCCPASKVSQLEYKLFRKYGKGPWASRAPASCSGDDWDLLI